MWQQEIVPICLYRIDEFHGRRNISMKEKVKKCLLVIGYKNLRFTDTRIPHTSGTLELLVGNAQKIRRLVCDFFFY